MGLRRPWRDAEPLSNLFVGATGRDELHDLLLSRSQNGRALLHRRRHGRDANNGVLACQLPKRRIWRPTPSGGSVHCFSEPLDEIIEARIWAGLHFRTADVQGHVLGEKVAGYMAEHYLQPIGR